MDSFTGGKSSSRRRLSKQKPNMRPRIPRHNNKNNSEETIGFTNNDTNNNNGLHRDFLEFRQFVKERTNGEGKSGTDIRNRLAAAKVKNLLDHQLAMLKLTRKMNKLLSDLTGKGNPNNYYNKHSKNSNNNYYFEPPHSPPTHMPNSNTNGKTSSDSRFKKSKKKSDSEYIIFSGGPKGLEYSSLKKSKTGTFRMEIDVSEYEPEQITISTENKKTMHVKAAKSKSGERKTLKIISPNGIDIDEVKILYPCDGILLLEAP